MYSSLHNKSTLLMLRVLIQQPASKVLAHPLAHARTLEDPRRRIHFGRVLGRVVQPQAPERQAHSRPLSRAQCLVKVDNRGHNDHNTLDQRRDRVRDGGSQRQHREGKHVLEKVRDAVGEQQPAHAPSSVRRGTDMVTHGFFRKHERPAFGVEPHGDHEDGSHGRRVEQDVDLVQLGVAASELLDWIHCAHRD